MQTTRRGFFAMAAAVAGCAFVAREIAALPPATVPVAWHPITTRLRTASRLSVGDFIGIDSDGTAYQTREQEAVGVVLSSGDSSAIVRLF